MQESEVVQLVVAIALLPLMWSEVEPIPRPRRSITLAAIACMYVTSIATIAEGFLWPAVLNAVEHGALALAGVLAVGTLLAYRREHEAREGR